MERERELSKHSQSVSLSLKQIRSKTRAASCQAATEVVSKDRQNRSWPSSQAEPGLKSNFERHG